MMRPALILCIVFYAIPGEDTRNPFWHQQKHHQQRLQQQMCATPPKHTRSSCRSQSLKQPACQLYDCNVDQALPVPWLSAWKSKANLGAGFGQPAVPGTGSSPDSAADIVAGLLSSPVTSTNVTGAPPQEGLPANLNSSNPMPLAPAPAVMLVSHLASF